MSGKKKKKEHKLTFRQRFGVLTYFVALAARENKMAVFWYFFDIVPTTLQPFVPIVFPKLILDELVGSRRPGWLLMWVLLMILSDTLLRFIGYYTEYKTTIGTVWFDQYIERKFSGKVMKMKFAFTENAKAMDQYQKALNGYQYSGGICTLLMELGTLLSAFFTMIGVIGIITTASPLLLALSALVVISSLILKAKEINVRIHFYNLRPKMDRIYGYVFHNLCDFAYGKDLRLYEGHGMIRKMASDASDMLYDNERASANGRQKYDLITGAVDTAKNMVTYGYLGILVLLGRITVGDFTMLMNAADTLTRGGILPLINNLQELGNDLELMNEYRIFMDYPEEDQEEEKGFASIPGLEGFGSMRKMLLPLKDLAAPLIEFRDVTFRYPDTDRDVLRHVNLKINPLEHISVVGENGAGKTTFIKLLCRLYPVTEGDILINGVSIYRYRYQEYMKLLSVVFQDFRLFSFTIRENLQLGAGGGENGAGALTDQRLREVCRMAGFSQRLESLPKGLDTGLYKHFYEDGIEPSGGEGQKLAIARALCKEAPVVVLDEPTAALDPVAEAEIYEHFQQMTRGKTAIFISHRLSSCQFCDRILVFAGSRVAESGTHGELLEKPDGIYAKMFRAQAEHYQDK